MMIMMMMIMMMMTVVVVENAMMMMIRNMQIVEREQPSIVIKVPANMPIWVPYGLPI